MKESIVLYKVLNDFTAVVITADHPEGIERRFRRQERISGEKSQLHPCNLKCNFVNQDFYGIGIPLAAIAPDGNSAKKN